MSESKNLPQRIHAVMKDISYIQKDKMLNNQYLVVTHDAVTALVRKSMVDHGIICWISDMFCEEAEMVLDGKNGPRKETRTKVMLNVVYANIDDPKDKIVTVSFGYGMDPGDKGVGKAVSYGFKYNLLKTFMLETGDDSDLEVSKQRATETGQKASNEREVKKSELWALMQANNLGDNDGVDRVEAWTNTAIKSLSVEGMQEVIDHINSGGGFPE